MFASQDGQTSEMDRSFSIAKLMAIGLGDPSWVAIAW